MRLSAWAEKSANWHCQGYYHFDRCTGPEKRLTQGIAYGLDIDESPHPHLYWCRTLRAPDALPHGPLPPG